MTDGQWALPAPLLPTAGSTGGRGDRPEKWDRRLVLDAIRTIALIAAPLHITSPPGGPTTIAVEVPCGS